MTVSQLLRHAERVLAGFVLLSAGFLALRPPIWGSHDQIPTTWVADLTVLFVGSGLALALWRRASAPPQQRWAAAGGALYLVALVFLGMALARLSLEVRERTATAFWPPKPGPARAVTIDSLAPKDAAEWALRLALHAAAGKSVAAVPAIPADWPFPAYATLAIRTTSDSGTELWARAGAGRHQFVCRAATAELANTLPSASLTPRCLAGGEPTGLKFAPPARTNDTAVFTSPADSATPWPQYRGNATRQGTATSASPDSIPHGWQAATHTEVRAGTSVIGSMVLVGGHNTGLVIALDVATGSERWITSVPNWVHQEPVSDGRIGVVGFGDNERSFWGRAPSGVTAFDIQTGHRLWTKFDESSVMTSPVLIDSVLIYASAAGVLRKRLLATGALLAERDLPGGVVMAPPLILGDTVVVTLEASHVCALLAADFRQLWCRNFPGLQMFGHASPTVDAGIVIASSVATPAFLTIGEFLRLPVGLQMESVREMLFPRYWSEVWPGQLFTGLELSTGRVVWRSPLFGERRELTGHSAGTAAVENGIGVIVLPLADTVVAFETRTGAIRWSSGANGARGAALILNDEVVVSGRNGIIEIRQLTDGALKCTITRSVGYDRAGPVRAGGLVIFANLEGEVEAISVSELMSCTAYGASRPQRRD